MSEIEKVCHTCKHWRVGAFMEPCIDCNVDSDEDVEPDLWEPEASDE